MAKNIVKYHSIYLFIVTLSLIGFISGFFFYKVQNTEKKEYISTNINIEEDLSRGTNNIIKSIKNSTNTFINSIIIITQIKNISKIFINPFEIGFIFSFLLTYNFKFSFLYTSIYLIIPLLFNFILIRISITISIDIIKLILIREKKGLKHLKLICIKYLLITSFLLLYELILSIFSSNINAYLMTILKG